MKNYKTILVAVDLTRDARSVTKRALDIAEAHNSTVHIIHVVEPLSYAYGSENLMGYTSVEADLQEQAKNQLQKFSAHYEIPESHTHMQIGSAASAIHELAEKLKADLVVVGSHGRTGVALLLGSTANSVLHGSKCDVLAVRVGND